MTNSELQRLQDSLGIVLPTAYVEIMRGFPAELQHWPAWADEESRTFYSDVDALLDVNNMVRENPGQFVKFPKEFRVAWPRNLFLFGDYNRESFYLIDINQPDPRVESIFNGAIRPSFPNLKSLYSSFQHGHSERWKEDGDRPKQPPKAPNATLSFSDLLAEARHFARPATVLSVEGTEYAAYWKGAGVVAPPPGEWDHWISFDASIAPNNPHNRVGVLSVYLCTEDNDQYFRVAVSHDNAAKLPLKPDGERLYAHQISCLPPIEVVFRFGRQPIQSWLAANDWNAEWGYNSNYADSPPVEEYLNTLRAEHPLFHDEEFYAMLGGWSFSFDKDWGKLVDLPLLLLSIRDAEPWLEVYDDGKDLLGFSRIT